jgi:hypothetical protein
MDHTWGEVLTVTGGGGGCIKYALNGAPAADPDVSNANGRAVLYGVPWWGHPLSCSTKTHHHSSFIIHHHHSSIIIYHSSSFIIQCHNPSPSIIIISIIQHHNPSSHITLHHSPAIVHQVGRQPRVRAGVPPGR